MNLSPHDLSIQIRDDAIDQLGEVADSFNLDYKISRSKNLMVVDLPEVVEEEL